MTITLPADLTDEALITELQKRGYRVTKERDADWITLSQLAAKVGRACKSLSRTIATAPGKQPPGLEIERHGRGRIQAVRASEEFYTWLRTR